MIVDAGTVCVSEAPETIVCVVGVLALGAAKLALVTPTMAVPPLIGFIWKESEKVKKQKVT